MNPAIRLLVIAIEAAKVGIDYRKGEGAFCPFCRERLRTYRTIGGRPTIRYCRCTNTGCPMNEMEISIKTVQ